MRPGLHSELWRATVIALFALLFGFSLGHPLEVLLMAVIIYLLWTLRTVEKLFHWLDSGMRNLPPDDNGVWGEISHILLRQKRRSDRTQDKMRDTIRRISSITEAIDEGILVIRADETLDMWNKAAKTYLNLQPGDRNTPITNLIRHPRFVEFIHSTSTDEQQTLEIPSPINTSRSLHISASKFGDDETVLVITDVTKLRTLEQLRREFVGNVSHELRTPLTVLRGYLETLGDNNSNPAINRAYTQMEQQVERMQALADDLIELSKLEAQSSIDTPAPIPILPTLQNIVEEAKVLGTDKHPIKLHCSPEQTLSILEKDLHSVIGNLVTNAIRHNPQGASVSIEVTGNETHLIISVSDNGVGIPAESLPRLTERFYRTDSSRNSQIPGTGLGLAIVKHILNRYQGELTVQSRLGEGANFVCRFSI